MVVMTLDHWSILTGWAPIKIMWLSLCNIDLRGIILYEVSQILGQCCCELILQVNCMWSVRMYNLWKEICFCTNGVHLIWWFSTCIIVRDCKIRITDNIFTQLYTCTNFVINNNCIKVRSWMILYILLYNKITVDLWSIHDLVWYTAITLINTVNVPPLSNLLIHINKVYYIFAAITSLQI